jgi:hypothetical protein
MKGPALDSARLEELRFARLAPLYVVPGKQRSEPVDQRTDGDCMRGAVASLLGLEYEQTPEIGPAPSAEAENPRAAVRAQQRAWETWFSRQGLELHHIPDVAATHLPLWIAGVKSGREIHSVAMHNDKVFHNPSPKWRRWRPGDELDFMEVDSSLMFCIAGASWTLNTGPGENCLTLREETDHAAC